MVIAGHTRIAVARSLGLQTVPVRYMKLSRTEAELLAIADNKLGEISDWNEDMLKDILSALPENDLDDIGFSNEELELLLDNVDTELPPESDNAVYGDDYEDADNLDLERVKIAEEGGIYAIGDQYVLCGDCVEVMRSFPEKFNFCNCNRSPLWYRFHVQSHGTPQFLDLIGQRNVLEY